MQTDLQNGVWQHTDKVSQSSRADWKHLKKDLSQTAAFCSTGRAQHLIIFAHVQFLSAFTMITENP